MEFCSLKTARKDLWKELIVKTFKDKNYFMLKIILASVISAIALEKNNLEAVIGSTLIAPLGSIIVMFSIVFMDMESKYFRYSLTLIVTAFVVIFLIGCIIGKIFEDTKPSEEIKKRHVEPDKYTFYISFIIGLSYAFVLLTTNDISDDGIGAGIAITLLPPMINIGLTLMKKTINKKDKTIYIRNSLLTSFYTLLGVLSACIISFSIFCKL
jgi:uncharacterized membrane protein